MILLIKILIILACAALFRWGGASFKLARRLFMPLLLAASLAVFTRTWWIFLASGAGLQLMGLGYGEDSPLYKAFGPWVARGVWGVIVALGASVGLLVAKKLGFLEIPYLAANFAIGAILDKNKAPDWLIEPCIGAGIAALVLCI